MAELVPADSPAGLETSGSSELGAWTLPSRKRFGRRVLNRRPDGSWPDPEADIERGAVTPSPTDPAPPPWLPRTALPNGDPTDATRPGSTSLLSLVSSQFESLFGEFIAPLIEQFREVERERGRLEAQLAAAIAERDEARAEVTLLREILSASQRRENSRDNE